MVQWEAKKALEQKIKGLSVLEQREARRAAAAEKAAKAAEKWLDHTKAPTPTPTAADTDCDCRCCFRSENQDTRHCGNGAKKTAKSQSRW